jgi:hypothetical protein
MRLPDLSYDHPDFIAAIKQANTANVSRSDFLERWGQITTPKDLRITDFLPPKQPDAVAYSLPQIIQFMHVARKGHILLYHSGDLATDIANNIMCRDKQKYLQIARELDLVGLRQSRVRDGWYHYYAVRTDTSLRGCPLNMLTGTITPDEFIALTAINERQAAISVTRCIRNALSTTDHEASDIRNKMIRKGWVTNGRPPELTPLGLSLLT